MDVARLRCRGRGRGRAYAPTSNTASHDNHEKIHMSMGLSKDVEKNPGPTQYNTEHHEVIIRHFM